jgi:mannosylglycerate hydrolase
MAEKSMVHIVPHTHWDREWRYPIWKNRMVLIEFMDQLLDILDTRQNYKQFIMDGQSVVIEDYLEIRPENTAKVKQYIKEGRITCGPWYTLPDLYPLDGECLVRNLLKGYRVSNEFGSCLTIGYTSFGWGQTAQFPQIFAGFGIDFVITAKHVDEKRAPESEFWWEAPDGTKVLTSRLGIGARAMFFVTTLIQSKYGVKNDDDYHFEWQKSGVIYHKANAEDSYEDYFKEDSHDTFYPDRVKPSLQECLDATEATTVKSERLMLAGCDFTGPIPELDKIIDVANESFDETRFKHSTIQEYVENLKHLVKEDQLRVIKGELRDGPSSRCSGNALSTRLYIKQLNKKAQTMLINKAEPLAAIMAVQGKEYPTSFLKKAWDYMLKAHPHDSINGVTQDRTAEDNMYRLNQVIEIAGVCYEKATSELLQLADLSRYSNEDLLLLVINTLPFKVSDIIKVDIDIPYELNCWDFRILDDQGREAEVQWIDKKEDVVPVHDLHARPWPFHLNRHTVYFAADEIPAGGFRVYQVVPKTRFARSFVSGPTLQKISNGREICITHNTMENEYLIVEVNSNGTLKLTNKETDRIYDGMHYFEETGEVGDYWINLAPFHNKTYTSHGCQAKIWIQDNGYLAATLGIEIKMEVPAYGHRPDSFFGVGSGRSNQYHTMTFTSFLTLKRGSRSVDIKLKIDNNAEDHRVRVMYPTQIKTDYAYAEGHFGVDKRPVMPKEDYSEEYNVDMQTLPQQSFVDVTDGMEGIAFIHNCFTEYELRNDGKSTLGLTLIRGVRNIICSESRALGKFPDQKGGQCLGLSEYNYSIYPHSAGWEEGKVYKKAKQFNIPLTVIQTAAHNKGSLLSGTSFFEIASDALVLSSFKKAEDRASYIVRLYNPTEQCIHSHVMLLATIKKAYLTNLNEERLSELNVQGSMIPVSVEKCKIITVEIEV